MRYSLWSHGRLLGHTDLDIPCVQATILQGFIEPTELGQEVLPDATGVARVVSAGRRSRRGSLNDSVDTTEFEAACCRREALDLELRDESGALLSCDFMRVHDISNQSLGGEETGDLFDDGEDVDSSPDFQLTPELEAAVESDLRLLIENDASAWIPDDIRWETMQYHVMVFRAETLGISDE